MSSDVPSLRRRLICNLYEGLLLLAYLFLISLPFVIVTGELTEDVRIWTLRIYLLLMCGLYFVTFWRKGQTLAMKTWRIRLEGADGSKASLGQLWRRYLLACLNLGMLGIGWWFALRSDDRQFLQDRWAGTRLVRT